MENSTKAFLLRTVLLQTLLIFLAWQRDSGLSHSLVTALGPILFCDSCVGLLKVNDGGQHEKSNNYIND